MPPQHSLAFIGHACPGSSLRYDHVSQSFNRDNLRDNCVFAPNKPIFRTKIRSTLSLEMHMNVLDGKIFMSTRRSFLENCFRLSLLFTTSVLVSSTKILADEYDILQHIKLIRDMLELSLRNLPLIEADIKNARWDSARTILSKPPYVDLRNSTKQLADIYDQVSKTKGKESLVSVDGFTVRGIREDLLSALKLLDTFCYNNVFVDEGRIVLGLKIDYDGPLGYLNDVKEALEGMIDILPSQ